MATQTIYVSASREQVRKVIGTIPATARRGGAADTITVRIGLVLLANIKKAFVTKARGGVDEAGERWQPLSPRTIAYRRRHPGLMKQQSRARLRPSASLTKKQRDRWWAIYCNALARYKGDKGTAARSAWFVLKNEGAITLLDKYGNTPVEILRDTGLLLNSLSPGVRIGAKAAGGPPEQIFRVRPGEVTVGTNRKHAGTHHHGVPGKIPQRRLWPEPYKWPSSWWKGILEQSRAGVIDLMVEMLKRM